MHYDLKISGGLVYDGSGGDADVSMSENVHIGAGANIDAPLNIDDLDHILDPDDIDAGASAGEPRTPAPQKGPSPLAVRLAEVHPDELTPREALDLIYELRSLLDEE